MQSWQIGVVLVALAGAAVVMAGSKAKGKNALGPSDVKKRAPLTKREQGMYFRLRETFPELVVLSQVSFSALITGRSQAIRNRFNRKHADFVLCTKAFEVVAVIELDDSSHEGREEQDKERAEMLTVAGIRVERFRQVPDVAELLKRFGPTESPTPSRTRATAKKL